MRLYVCFFDLESRGRCDVMLGTCDGHVTSVGEVELGKDGMGNEHAEAQLRCRGSVDVLTIKTSSAGVTAQTLVVELPPCLSPKTIATATRNHLGAISRATAQNGVSSNDGVSLTNTMEKLILSFPAK